MGNVPSEVGTKHTKPATHCTDSCREELGELLDTQSMPTHRQSSTHPFLNFSNHHDACLTEFGDSRRHCVEKFVDRNDESEESNAMQQQLSKKFLDTDTAEQHNAEAITVLLEVSSNHFPKMEDVKWVRKNFKRQVLPLMKVCTMPSKSVIFRCGEKGTCTYLVADGELEVHDEEGNVISTLTRGAMFGETSMLYDCPRFDTVICTATTTLWRLNRSAYYALQKIINSPALSVNAKRLFEVIPEVVVLPLENKEKLMLRMASTTFTEGMNLYEETKCSTRVMVIEDGYVNLHFSHLFLRRSPEDLLRELGISVDLTQCQKHAENRTITWEDILNHPLSETQLKERDEHELGELSASAVALALEALDLDTSDQPRRDMADGQTDIVGDTSGPCTPTSTSINDMSRQSTSPSSMQKNINMLLQTEPQTSTDSSVVDTIQGGQSGMSPVAASESRQGSKTRPTTATTSRREGTSNTRPDTASSSTSSSKHTGNTFSSSASLSSKTPPVMLSGSRSGPLRQASTGRLFGDRAPLDQRNSPHHPSLSPITLPPMDTEKVSPSGGVHRLSQRGTSEKINSTSPMHSFSSPLGSRSRTNSPSSSALFSSLNSPGPGPGPGSLNPPHPHSSSSSGVRFLTTPSSLSSSSKNLSTTSQKDKTTSRPGSARTLDASKSLSRRDLPPPRQTSSRT